MRGPFHRLQSLSLRRRRGLSPSLYFFPSIVEGRKEGLIRKERKLTEKAQTQEGPIT
jgi:hypothetical protein